MEKESRKIEFEPTAMGGMKTYKMFVSDDLVEAVKRLGKVVKVNGKGIYLDWFGLSKGKFVYNIYCYNDSNEEYCDVEEEDIEKLIEKIREADEELRGRKKLVFYL